MVRDGLVQRFEFTYEFLYKILRRFLGAGSCVPTAFVWSLDLALPENQSSALILIGASSLATRLALMS